MRKTRSVLSFFLAVITAISLFATVTVVSAAKSYGDEIDTMIAAAVHQISESEGNYGSVSGNDSGALSVGKLQWHADFALQLLRFIIAEDTESNAKSVLGAALYAEIMNSSTKWGTRKLTNDEAKKLSDYLSSPVGRQGQDDFAAQTVYTYIQNCYQQGLTNPYAMIFVCDIFNKGETAGYNWMRQAAKYAGSYRDVTLEHLYKTARAFNNGSVPSRYQKLYNFCKNDVDLGELSLTDSEEWVIDNSSTNIRTAPGTSGTKVIGSYKYGTHVTITEKREMSGQSPYLWGKTEDGWIALTYSRYISGRIYCPNAADPVSEIESVKIEKVTTDGYTLTCIVDGAETVADIYAVTSANAKNVTQQLSLDGSSVTFDVKVDAFGDYDGLYTTTVYLVDEDKSVDSVSVNAGVSKTADEDWQVDTSTLNVRSGPGTMFGTVGSYHMDDIINIIELYSADSSYFWGKTDLGWVALDYCKRLRTDMVLGDVNRDGLVDISDAMLVFYHVSAKSLLDNSELYDMNGDGELDIVDAMLLFYFVAGKTESLS